MTNRIHTTPCPKVGKKLQEIWVGEGMMGILVSDAGTDLTTPTGADTTPNEVTAFRQWFAERQRQVPKRASDE
jgi:hypothetical protein